MNRSGPTARERELREAMAALRRGLRAGEDVSAEAILGRHPALWAHEESAIELIYGEFAIREELRQRPEPGEWLRRFPGHRERLERLFALHEIFGDFDDRPPAAPEPPPPRPADGPPRRFGRFDLLEVLGRGGEGIVYRALDRERGRVVALKLILEGVHAASDDRRRLRDEADACRRLRHPHIVAIHEFGEVEGLPYLALEYVEGRSLARTIAGEPQPIGRAVRLMVELAEAVGHFHAIGIIHRDLNPSNVLVTDVGDSAKLSDFGLVKFLDEALTRSRSATLAGTPGYLAPEVALGRADEVGPASDVFSLGAILYELLTGRAPFEGPTPMEALRRTIEATPRPPGRLRRGVPGPLATIALNCLDRDPHRRYASADDLADDLRRFRDGRPTRGRLTPPWERLRRRAGRIPWRSVAAATVAALALAGATVAWWGGVPHEQFRATHARAERIAAEAAEARRIADRAAYASRIKRAHEQWDDGHHELALELIEDAPAGQRGFEWSYLDRLYHRDFSTLRGHDRWARTLALAPDGRALASGDEGGTVVVWDLPARRERARFRGPEGPVVALAFAADGAALAAATEGPDPSRGRVAVWDIASGRALAGPIPFAGPVREVEFAPGGPALIVTEQAAPGVVRSHLVEWSDGTGPRVEVEPLGEGGPVVSSPDGRWLAWAGARGEATLVDRRAGRVAWRSGHPGDARTRLAFSADGSMVASAGPGVVRWREAASGREVASRAVDGDFFALAFAPDGRSLAAALNPPGFACWDAATGRPRPLAVAVDDVAGAFAFRRDGRSLALGHKGPPALVDLDSGLLVGRFPFGVKTAGVSDLLFTRDDRTLVIASEGRRLRLWDVEPEPDPPQVAGHATETWSLAFAPDGRSLASGSDDNTIRLWDRATGGEAARIAGHDGTVTALAYARGGARLAYARLAREGVVGVWDVAGRRTAWLMPAHRDGARAVAFAPDGRSLASAGSDGVVRTWDAATGRALASFEGHTKAVRAVAFAPDDAQRLASAGNDGTIRLWDLVEGRCARVLAGPEKYAALAFSPDGRRLAAANEVGSVEVWDVAGGRVVQDLLGHKTGARAVAYAPDGRTIATGGEDATVRLWDATTGQEFLTLSGHKQAVVAVAFDPSGRVLASGSFDGAVTLWYGHE